METALFLLMFASHAFAGGGGHGKHYPACDTVKAQASQVHLNEHADSKPCTTHNDHHAELHAVVDETKEMGELNEAGEKMKLSALKQLQQSVDARDKLLTCLQGGGEGCEKSVQLAKDRITRSLRMLRVLSSLTSFNNPEYDAPTPESGRLPMYLGGGRMGPFTAAERDRARNLRRKALTAAERFAEVDIKGKSYTLQRLQEMCAQKSADLPDACDWAALQKTTLRRQFAREMQNLADDVVRRLPIVAQFNEIPITDQKLAEALKGSRESLRSWQKEFVRKKNSDPDMLLAYPELMDGVLAENPALCATIQKKMGELEHARHSNEGKMALTKLGLGVGVCLLTSGAGCMTFGGAVAASYIKNDYERMAFEKRNLLASDPGGNLANVNRARSAQHDFLIQAAFAGSLASFPVAKAATRVAGEAVVVTEAAAGQALAREAAKETLVQGKETAIHHYGTEGVKAVVNRGDPKDRDAFRSFVVAELEEADQ